MITNISTIIHVTIKGEKELSAYRNMTDRGLMIYLFYTSILQPQD